MRGAGGVWVVSVNAELILWWRLCGDRGQQRTSLQWDMGMRATILLQLKIQTHSCQFLMTFKRKWKSGFLCDLLTFKCCMDQTTYLWASSGLQTVILQPQFKINQSGFFSCVVFLFCFLLSCMEMIIFKEGI